MTQFCAVGVSEQDYNVTIQVYPDLTNYTDGITLTLKCVVDPAIADASITPIFSWQCDTSCFADGMTTPTIIRCLTDNDSGAINCSVTIDGDEYMSDNTFDLQVIKGIKVYVICICSVQSNYIRNELCKYHLDLTYDCVLM